MENFYKKIKKDNKQNKIWMIMWLVAMCSFVFKLDDDSTREVVFFIFILALATYEYLTKYFFLYKEGKYQVEKYKFLFFLNSLKYSNFSEILRQHAFSLRDYIKILIYKFIPVQVVTALLAIAYELLYYYKEKKYVSIYAIVKIWSIFVVPFLVANIFYMVKKRELTNDGTKASRTLLLCGDKILQFYKIGFSLNFVFEIVFVAYSVVISKLILSASEDKKWKFAMVYTDEFAIVLLVLVGLLVFFSISRYRTTTLRVFLGFLTIAILVIMCVFMFKKNIIVDNGGITVTMKYKSVHYGYRDIDYYEQFTTTYEPDEDEEYVEPSYIYMLTMKNGRKVKLDFDNMIFENNIEEDGQVTEESDNEKVRRRFDQILIRKRIPKRK